MQLLGYVQRLLLNTSSNQICFIKWQVVEIKLRVIGNIYLLIFASLYWFGSKDKGNLEQLNEINASQILRINRRKQLSYWSECYD